MVTTIVEISVDRNPLYKSNTLVELNGGKIGYIMTPHIFLPESFRWVPIQDDEVRWRIPSDIAVYIYSVELMDGKETTYYESQIKRKIDQQEQDVEYLRSKIKELENQLRKYNDRHA